MTAPTKQTIEWIAPTDIKYPTLKADDTLERSHRRDSTVFGRKVLKASISRYGLFVPLVIDRDEKGRAELVDGISRLVALKALKAEKVPCVMVEYPDGSYGSAELRRINAVIARIDSRLDRRLSERADGLVAAQLRSGMSVDDVARVWFGKATAKARAEIEAAAVRGKGRRALLRV